MRRVRRRGHRAPAAAAAAGAGAAAATCAQRCRLYRARLRAAITRWRRRANVPTSTPWRRRSQRLLPLLPPPAKTPIVSRATTVTWHVDRRRITTVTRVRHLAATAAITAPILRPRMFRPSPLSRLLLAENVSRSIIDYYLLYIHCCWLLVVIIML